MRRDTDFLVPGLVDKYPHPATGTRRTSPAASRDPRQPGTPSGEIVSPALSLFENEKTAVALVRSWLTAVTARAPRVVLGTIVATPGAVAAIPGPEVRLALLRHSVGDWGDLEAHDWLENDAALGEGRRLLSEYSSRSGSRFWIVTEADRSVTTILQPEEY